MTTLNFSEGDKLDSASNFIPSKCRLQMILEEAKLWEHDEKEIVPPIDIKWSALHVKEAKENDHSNCREDDY